MTLRSDRDAAVARLIEAVGRWRAGYIGPVPVTTNVIVTNVLNAYDHLVSIPLEVPTEPKANIAAPLTAHWAARSMRNLTLHGRILTCFFRSDMRSIGWTVEELEHRLNLRHQTCSPRINELRNSGWIYAPGDTRKNISGREAEVYVLTPQGVSTMWAAKRTEEES